SGVGSKNLSGHGDNPQGRPTEKVGTLRDLTFGVACMNLDAGWVTGFVDGEGCFYVGMNAHPDMTAGFQVIREFTVVQHQRDVQLVHALKAFFGCGVVRSDHGDRKAFRVRGKKNLLRHIVPFFESHPLQSKKQLDFEKFRRVLLLMESGEHLAPSGIDRIRELASRMNRGAMKIKSSLSGNPEDELSEIPCRVS